MAVCFFTFPGDDGFEVSRTTVKKGLFLSVFLLRSARSSQSTERISRIGMGGYLKAKTCLKSCEAAFMLQTWSAAMLSGTTGVTKHLIYSHIAANDVQAPQ